MDGQPGTNLLGELRRVAGLTQEELAERTGLTVRGISNIERGRVAQPRRRSLEALARGLGERLAHDRGLAAVAAAMRSARRVHHRGSEDVAPDGAVVVVRSAARRCRERVAAAGTAPRAALGRGRRGGRPGRRRGGCCERLVAGHLLEHRVDGRDEFHDLVRDYARSLADRRRPAAMRRLAGHYLSGAAAAADAIAARDPNRRPLLTPEVGGRTFSGSEEAASWLATELPTLLALAEESAAAGGTAYARDLSTVLWQALRLHGHYDALHTLHGFALAEARLAGDPFGEQQALTDVAAICARVGRYDEAVERLTACLEVPGSRTATARALTTLGTVYAQLGRYPDAAHHLREAVELAREVGDTLNEGRAYGNLGFVHEHLGELDAAR